MRQQHCAVVELRQYTLHPRQRDVLIELFEREFIEPQEAVGISVIGQFRDLDDPDRFVWLRGFADMSTRAQALAAFYDGPVWRAHRDVANATMVDSDNVLLLRPLQPSAAIGTDAHTRLPAATTNAPLGEVVATICALDDPADRSFIEFFERSLRPALEASGASLLGSFVTEHSVNTFPRLPVREGEHVFVWLSRFARAAVQAKVQDMARTRLKAAPQVLRLAPTARSGLHG